MYLWLPLLFLIDQQTHRHPRVFFRAPGAIGLSQSNFYLALDGRELQQSLTLAQVTSTPIFCMDCDYALAAALKR